MGTEAPSTPRSKSCQADTGPSHESKSAPIAIIGIGCRLPGSITNPSQLWDFLANERSAAEKVPSSRFNVDSYHGSKNQPSTTQSIGGYFLQEDIRNFENQFFGINNREASVIDPQQRKLLEVVFESFESAGVSLNDVSGANVGCYVASFMADHAALQTKDVEGLTRYSQTGMGTTILANRISHVFNLKGPSSVIDTACSSSFYALHAACSALLADECDSAVVAGVNLIQSPDIHVSISLAGALSPTSTCHTFDSSADGYGRADGINAVYIKRLDDAIRDGDPIRSIIRSTAVNSNGRTPGIALPSVEGQEAVIRKTYARAGLDPSHTRYVEAHGTGTSVGDPIEIEALSRVFGMKESSQPTLIGSVKTNLGHSEAASGLTSIIKATLMLENGLIPATIGLKQLNPKIKPRDQGVEIVTAMTRFPDQPGAVRRISINSFGYGGANAHGILEAVEPLESKSYHNNSTSHDSLTAFESAQTYLLPLSANQAPSLHRRVVGLRNMDLSNISISDLAYTLAERRTHFTQRGYILARQGTLSDDIQLENLHQSHVESDLKDAKFSFVFTGQGAQWAGMARELMQFTTFSDTIRKLDDDLSFLPHAPAWRIREVLLDSSETSPINQAEYAQPMTTAIQIGLVNLLQDWSILPQVTIGHSSGEIGAAYAAGLLSAREAIIIAYYRGFSVVKSTSDGLMAAVGLAPDDARSWIKKLELKVQVACINSPESVTISGDGDAVHRLVAFLQEKGIFARTLKTNGKAYHSHHMTAIGPLYEGLLAQSLNMDKEPATSPRSRFTKMFSTVLCEEVDEKEIRTPSYWRKNLESPVRFSEGLTALHKATDGVRFIEIGPHSALKMPIMSTLGNQAVYFTSLTRGKDSSISLLSLVGDLFNRGFMPNFSNLNKSYTTCANRPRVLRYMPTYPWHYEEPAWSESRVIREVRFRKHPRHELLGSEVAGGNMTTFGWRNLLRLSDVPWLHDHKLGDTVVFPGAGYMAMAIEALTQKLPEGDVTDKHCVIIRHMDLLKALPLADEESVELYTELRPLAISNTQNSKDWWEFQISSISDDVATIRAKGSMRFDIQSATLDVNLPSIKSRIAPQSKRLWYESISKSGLGFGPSFQLMDEIYTSDPKGAKYAEVRTRSLSPEVKTIQSKPRYIIHPTLLDSLFQAGLVASTGGFVRSIIAKVPTRVGEAMISLPAYPAESGRILAISETCGPSSDRLNSFLLDAHDQPVAHFQDVDVTTYAGSEKMEIRHPMFRVIWKPDVDKIVDNSSFAQAIKHIASARDFSHGSEECLLAAVDLFAHKNPDAQILCLGPDAALVERMMAVLGSSSHHRRFRSFSLGRQTSEGELQVAEVLEYNAPVSLDSLVYTKAIKGHYDLVLILEDLISLESLRASTTEEAILLRASVFNPTETQPLAGFSVVATIDTGVRTLQLLRPLAEVAATVPKPSTIIQICDPEAQHLNAQLNSALGAIFGVQPRLIALQDVETSSIPDRSLIISTVEVQKAVMARPTSEEFEAVKKVIEIAETLVWVTGSGLHKGFDPTLSVFPGLARAIMIEQPSTKIFTLEISPNVDATALAQDIALVLSQAKRTIVDYEYLKDDCGLMISRTIPDAPMNEEFRKRDNAISTLIPLGDAGNVSLSLQRPGQFSTAQFIKKPNVNSACVGASDVVVKVQYMGLNAKDIYALSGRVSTNKATCSLEFTGHVVSVGSSVKNFTPGDKVAVMHPTHFSTYETVPARSCVKLRDDEDMASMASVLVVFMTATYALYHRARLQPGETILIHSGAGGVGIAAIQIAKHIGAEIFATVSTEEKKQYLVDAFGLEPDHIFSSRDLGFAPALKRATGGHGVDVILNSLVGDLLHESWECLNEFGRFVEIGKRDIIDGGRLNMSMLAGSTTFTAFDLSLLVESTSPAQQRVHQELLVQTMQLLRDGIVQPVKPLAFFNAADVSAAFHNFNNAKRMGKIVISFKDQAQMIPVVPERFSTKLDANKSYLLVGCLGGLGRSLSRWMMDRGARQFIFIGRTGIERPAAKRLVEDLERSGAQCHVVKGDVTNYDDVVRAITTSSSPLGGVVQAAMGLHEAIFKYMSYESWLTGTEAKIKGTWNLHNALSAHGKERDLDFFIMTSSISGKVGTATEGNYCAANNFLDVFARYRRSLGLKATSIGLGAISEVGYLHENPHIEDLLLRKGIRSITEDELIQIFDFGLSNPPSMSHSDDVLSHPHLLTGLEVTGLEEKHKQGYEGYWQFLHDARFSVLTNTLKRDVSGNTQTSGSQGLAIKEAIASKSDDNLRAAVKEVIAKKLSNMILLPVEKVDVKTPLSDYGMDSMLAAELRQYIFGATGVDVLFLTLMDAKSSISTLVNVVVDKLQTGCS